MTLELLAIGEVMAEIRQSGKPNPDSSPGKGFDVGFAGDTFNTAVYCARALGSTTSVAYMSRVGTDPLSESFLDFAHSENIDTSHVSRDSDNNIGIYSVATDAAGERTFHYWRKQSAARELFSVDEAVNFIPNAKITYLSGITLAILHPVARQRLISYLKDCVKSGQTLVAFDSNYRPLLWESHQIARETIAEMWDFVDIALPSIDDELALFGEQSEADVISRFSQRTWTACAIKRGVRGPVSTQFPADKYPAFEAADVVIDTTAAGDSFNGAYLAAFLQGHSEIDCLLAGHNCASNVVGAHGAIVPLGE